MEMLAAHPPPESPSRDGSAGAASRYVKAGAHGDGVPVSRGDGNGSASGRPTHGAVLEVRGLTARYAPNKQQVLRGISFAVGSGDFLVIIGPSGAGKSTLMRCINRLVEPSSGEILFMGADVVRMGDGELRRLRRHIGMIFQEFNLVQRLSVIENVLSGRLGYTGTARSVLRLFRAQDIARALQLLGRVGLLEFTDTRVDRLSGGQRQRVGIARALMQEPKLLLVDEPTSNLDPRIAGEVMALIKGVATDLGIPVLCNLHDVPLALAYATRVVGLQDGLKRFEGPPEAVDRRALEDIYAGEAA